MRSAARGNVQLARQFYNLPCRVDFRQVTNLSQATNSRKALFVDRDAKPRSVAQRDAAVLDERLTADPGHPRATGFRKRIGIERRDRVQPPDFCSAMRANSQFGRSGHSVNLNQLC